MLKATPSETGPSLGEVTRVFARIGVLSFGGPAAQIALMHRELVERRAWLQEEEYLRALSFCMLLPGPEAMQLATYAGWKLKGTKGGLIAGLLFVIPGALVILALATAYALYGANPQVQALLLGVKAAVLGIVLHALQRIAKRALRGSGDIMIAILAFISLFLLNIPFPFIIVAAALWGWFEARGQPVTAVGSPVPPLAGTVRTVAIWLAIWLVPLAVLALPGPALLFDLGIYFSKLAVVTFGGAYAVLGWMTQTVVNDFGWIGQAQMIDALGLAETTPGPLILVTAFVGFLAAEARGGMLLGVVGWAVTLWMTFAPCFLWIFAGAPWLDHLTRRPALKGALAAITAAVVGVIASISVWFAVHVVFATVADSRLGPVRLPVPDPASLHPEALVLAVLAGAAILWRHWPLPLVLILSALLSWFWAQI